MNLLENYSKLAEVETPVYVYNLQHLKQNLLEIKKAAADYHVHYAVKANANSKILETIAGANFGADCVSAQEVLAAINNGFKPSAIAFAGVGKTDKEITIALENKIFSLNVESLEELKIINQLAANMGLTAPVAIRINPNVNANTHKYITTGLEENKFGINLWELDALFEILKELKSVKFVGLHFHIGSQIRDLDPFKNLCLRANEIQSTFVERGFKGVSINVGGGLGVDYSNPDALQNPSYQEFFDVFRKYLKPLPNQEVHFELGRCVVAQSGTLLSKVVFVKKGLKTNFAVLDAGMTELIRPALYQAYHKIENLTAQKNSRGESVFYDVVGPVCESSDCFGKMVKLPETFRNDVIAIRTAGAYGEVMASNYNLRSLPKAVFIE
ncbi:MAG: diaminopimelate decarboxylase [Luteibaculaceae bacterium]